MRVVCCGIGPIGAGVARLLLSRGFKVVGAVDLGPRKVGCDLGVVLGLRSRTGVRITADPAAIRRARADVALITTSSRLPEAAPAIEAAVRAGADVISSCEELAYPFARHPALAARLDRLARRHGVTILGAGVNPGFVMDFLPVCLGLVSSRIRRVAVTRVLDASRRRGSFQEKIGLGMRRAEFQRMRASGRMGHVGLLESLHLLAHGLGIELRRTRSSLNPLIATRAHRLGARTVARGSLAGLAQRIVAIGARGERLSLDLRVGVGMPEEFDRVEIAGTPRISCILHGGLHGDRATEAILVNLIPRVRAARPGLLTMLDLPPGGLSPRTGSPGL
ncbi:MAG: dihydrodipicolinate reductase [Deltaproteobacteria bacterium]|nr:dihydrodipicolinate reductase [Deltaproteobacteria bacterium]